MLDTCFAPFKKNDTTTTATTANVLIMKFLIFLSSKIKLLFSDANIRGNCPVLWDSFKKSSVFLEKNGYFNINSQEMPLTELVFSRKL